jgi:hypothetical protein
LDRYAFFYIFQVSITNVRLAFETIPGHHLTISYNSWTRATKDKSSPRIHLRYIPNRLGATYQNNLTAAKLFNCGQFILTAVKLL